jgi:hypothetical protein
VTATEGHEERDRPLATAGLWPPLRGAAIRDAGLNVLFMMLADCRGLAASLADIAVLKSFAEVTPAQRLAPTTARAHRALFAGLLPGSTADPPVPDSSLPVELGEAGYQTVGVAGDRSFNYRSLIASFERFTRRPGGASDQFGTLSQELDLAKPFFAFAYLADTRYSRDWGFVDQVAAAERVDAALPPLLSELPANTLVVACSDHGVCFGEGNCWGERDDHPAHRDVFVACFRLDGGPWP